jgi:hypothetical protein
MKLSHAGLCLLVSMLALSQPGCSRNAPEVAASLNQNAALVGDLPGNPLRWRVITSTVDRPTSTMGTLFGNDVAVEYARSHPQHDYPSGSVLCLVTWIGREDPRWYGAQIPARVHSAEFVTVAPRPGETLSYSYDDYEGSPLKKVSSEQLASPQGRTAYMLSLRAAVMP